VSDSPKVQLLRRCFDALREGDFAVLEGALAQDARWRSVEEGATNCEGRETIIEIMSRNLGGRLRGSIEETIQAGSRVLVGFRPQRPADMEARPLDGGIAYMVVTLDGAQIVELKGCADRTAAVGYLESGKLPENTE
jgi:ketosteroid isomerase-like protein